MENSIVKQLVLAGTCLVVIFLCLAMIHLGFRAPYAVVVAVFLCVIAWSMVILLSNKIWLQSLFGLLIGFLSVLVNRFSLIYLVFGLVVLIVTFWSALIANKEKDLRIRFAPEEILRRPMRWFLVVLITLIAIDLFYSPTFRKKLENFQMPVDWQAKVLQMSASEINSDMTVDQFIDYMIQTNTGKKATKEQLKEGKKQLGLDSPDIPGNSKLLSNKKALDILVGDKIHMIMEKIGPSLPLIVVVVLWGIAAGLFSVIVPLLLIVVIIIYHIFRKTDFVNIKRVSCTKEVLEI